MSTRTEKYDLTSGGILGKLLAVALPIMGTQLMQMAYNLADMFWLGRVGTNAVAASGTAGMFMWLSMAFIMVGRMGAEIGVSQSLGKADEKAALKYAQNAVFLSIFLGIGYALCMILFRYPLVGFFNIQEEVVAADTRLYLVIASLGIPLTFITSALVGAFNASGNSRTPFVINSVGLTANIILDPVLIFALDMGIAGAAFATILSQAVVCVLMIFAILRSKNRPFDHFSFFVKPERQIVRQIFRWTIPIGLESMIFTFLSMIISRFVNVFGAPAMAVSRIGSQIESLSWLIGGGFGSALTAYVGQNFGAGKWTRIHRGFRLSIGAMAVWGALVTILLFFCGDALFSLFLPDPKIIEMGAVYLKLLASCQLPMCLEFIAAGAFKGTGRTLEPSVVSIVSNGLRVPLAYVLSLTSLGLNGIWLGVSAGAILRGVWMFVWYLLAARKQPRTDAESA